MEIPAGKVRDFISGVLVDDRPEERVRQIFERRLVEEYGYSKEQIQTVPEFHIKNGTQKIGPVDIAVFRDKRKSFDNVYILIETKKKERTDGLNKLKSYSISPSQEYAVWFNGQDIVFLQKLPNPPLFREIPDIPRRGETLEDVGLYQKKDLKPASELKTIFETCHNYIYVNEGLLKEKTFSEVLKLIFIKMVDEKSPSLRCEFRITDREMEEIEQGKENKFIHRILNLFERVKRELSGVFDPNERINLKPITIAFIVSQLQKYSLINTPVDVKGTAFQTFVHAHSRGERGEFFTPYPILELAVKMLKPKDNEAILDPACGSGGFLIQAMKHVYQTIDASCPDLSERTLLDMKIQYARAYIKGIDINPDLTRVSKMRMILYDDEHTGIFSANSLESFEQINQKGLRSGAGEIKPESFDIILTNPPFGTKGKVTDKRILGQFELGHKWKKDKTLDKWIKTNEIIDGQPPDILFIERCLQFLKNKGRMAIVLPDGILTNITLGYVREFILSKAKILAIVSLPQETFVPYGAGTKASVLFLRKLNKEQLREAKKSNYPIFTAICEKIGYDLRGRINFKINEKGQYIDAEGKVVLNKENAEVDSDIEEIVNKFSLFEEKHAMDF